MYCFFFFSSRRRHTRFKCDWSSDVCSSDLFPAYVGAGCAYRQRDSCFPARREIDGVGAKLVAYLLFVVFPAQLVVGRGVATVLQRDGIRRTAPTTGSAWLEPERVFRER